MNRLGVANKNALAKFVRLSNLLEWPIMLASPNRLYKDQLFPMARHMAKSIEDYGHYYQLEKRNGRWQIQRVTPEGEVPVTDWVSTRNFLTGLDVVISIEQEKRAQE